ncbi:MAG: peroxide stress protein YaaA [Prolixibacteraceae bacterium]|nr:peroxide stress protein YaaA [Prolixibacteraceae bacterium]
MLAILSPAKDMKVVPLSNDDGLHYTLPGHLSVSEKLVGELKKLSIDEIAKLMKVNSRLAMLNYQRIQTWDTNHTPENSSPAVLSFTGEAYRGLSAKEFGEDELNYSQNVLRILSGLYGILRPLDLIQEYRFEMGTKRAFLGKKNLYEIWTGLITKSIEEAVNHSPGDKCLVNLASNEYSKAIKFKKSDYRVITPLFYEERGGQRKMVTVYAKRARGMMARFMIENRLEKVTDLQAFDHSGYYFESQNSSGDVFTFVR